MYVYPCPSKTEPFEDPPKGMKAKGLFRILLIPSLTIPSSFMTTYKI